MSSSLLHAVKILQEDCVCFLATVFNAAIENRVLLIVVSAAISTLVVTLPLLNAVSVRVLIT